MEEKKLYCDNDCRDEKEDGIDDDICCYCCSELEVCKRREQTCSFMKVHEETDRDHIMELCRNVVER